MASAPRRILSILQGQLTFIEEDNRTPAEINAAFRTILDVVEENITFCEDIGIDAHDALVSCEATRASVLALRARYFRGYERGRYIKVPSPMSMWEFAQYVYGDATKVTFLYLVNSVPDVTDLPVGRELFVLPID